MCLSIALGARELRKKIQHSTHSGNSGTGHAHFLIIPLTGKITKTALFTMMQLFNCLKGGGGNGYFFVKLDFEIAVDQQTRTSDRTFEGVPDPNRQTVPAGQPRPYLVQIRPNLAKSPEHAQNPYFMCSTCS